LEVSIGCASNRSFVSPGPTRAPPLQWPSGSTASLHVAPLRRVHDDAQSYANSGILRRGMMSALGHKRTFALQ
jgi:hypothetical protein